MERNPITLLLGVMAHRDNAAILAGIFTFGSLWATGALVLHFTGTSETWGIIGLVTIFGAPLMSGFVAVLIARERHPLLKGLFPLGIFATWVMSSWALGASGNDHPDAPNSWFLHLFRGCVGAVLCWFGCGLGSYFTRRGRDT
jgi:hypothetical protein